MTLSKRPYKGCRDFFPPLKRAQDHVFHTMEKVAQLYSYEPYNGPLLEEVELYKAKSGEELINDQIYSFHDRGERFVAIRPEMTPTLARMVASIHNEVSKPIRWYSIPNLMRYERPQKGRLREHWQFNCDIFGAPECLGELEVISLAISLLKDFGANESMFGIHFNDRQIVDTFFTEKLQLKAEEALKLYKLIDRSKKVSQEAFDKDLAEFGLDQDKADAFKQYLTLNSPQELVKFISEQKLSGLESSLKFLELLQSSPIQKYCHYDPCIVRGLDYYSGVVFEIFDKNPENPRAIAGGGAYANLLKIFNEKPLAGVGFGLGDVTLTHFLEGHKLIDFDSFQKSSPTLLVTYQDESGYPLLEELVLKLRESGSVSSIDFNLDPSKVNKAFKLAQAKGASFVLLLGEQEIKNKTVAIKNLETRDQQEFKISDLQGILTFLGQ